MKSQPSRLHISSSVPYVISSCSLQSSMNHDPDPGGNFGQFRSHDSHVIVTVEDRIEEGLEARRSALQGCSDT